MKKETNAEGMNLIVIETNLKKRQGSYKSSNLNKFEENFELKVIFSVSTLGWLMYKCPYVDVHYLCVSHWYQIRSIVFGLNVVALWESIYRKITESAYRKITWALPLQCSIRYQTKQSKCQDKHFLLLEKCHGRFLKILN